MRISFTIAIFSLVFIAIFPAQGQTCCSGGVPISTNLGLPPSLKGTTQFSLTYDVNVLRTLKQGLLNIDDRARERITRSLILSTGYAVTDRFSLEGLIPFVRQERNINQPGGFSDFESTQGIGDILVLFKYRLSSIDNSKHVFTVGAGPKMPTGSVQQVNGRGLILSADLQPGSGAWDAIFWGNYIHNLPARPTMSVYSVLTYRATGVNHNYIVEGSTYEIGDNLRILAGISDQFRVGSSMVNPSFGARYRYAIEDKFEGNPLVSTGGEWIFVIPGVGITITKNLIFETSFELPVYANPRGTQLTPTYRFNLGLYLVLNPKRSEPLNLVD